MSKLTKDTAIKIARLLLMNKAITLRLDKPFRYSSGILSPVYTDNRIIISYPKMRSQIIAAYIDVIKNKIGLDNIDLLSGTATAAIAHTAFISQKMNLPMVYVRSTKKNHGKQKQIEGVVKKGQKTVIIEDLISTGKSSLNNVKAIRKAGGIVKNVIVTINYELPNTEIKFKKEKIKVFTLANFSVVLNVASDMNIIKKQDKKIIKDWVNDPKGWAKRYGYE
jgi:orotate phosphoribosyltransferase